MSKRKNANCMQGLRCPKCGQDEELLVWAEMCVSLTDAGTDPHADSTRNHGGTEWNETSMTECPACGFSAMMAAFVAPADKRKTARAVSMPTLHTCEFVLGTDVVPREWGKWFWERISENAPFSWGDNNRSMVTASDFARHCEEQLDDSVKVKHWLKKVRALGETYIDLEN